MFHLSSGQLLLELKPLRFPTMESVSVYKEVVPGRPIGSWAQKPKEKTKILVGTAVRRVKAGELGPVEDS